MRGTFSPTYIALLLLMFVAGLAAAVLLQRHGYLEKPVSVAQLADGGVYRGSLRDGVLQGEGTLEWPYGSRYEGEFERGLMHGNGRFEDLFGFVYEGSFEHGIFSGTGTISTPDGARYTGEVLDWQMHGEGVYVEEGFEYRGIFFEDEVTGHAEHWREGELVYRGDFKSWLYHGQGELLEGEDRYEGDFEDGFLTSGTHRAANGDRYEGGFTYNTYDGEGVLYLAGGDRYEGGFSWGRYSGNGTMFLAQPRSGFSQYSGTWREGRLVDSEHGVFVEDYLPALERALYSEGEMLDAALVEVAAGDPTATEMYFLGVAGDGTQRVFARETLAMANHFASLGVAAERQLRLTNDRMQLAEQPMATRTSVRRALQTLSERMNLDEDVLVLYLTSHGSEDHQISLQNASLDLPDLSAADLAQWLHSSGIRWQIVFVSACYSGGFIEPLKSDNNLIITAAAADRTSFGCSDESDMTYFGGAVLDNLSVAKTVQDLYARVVTAVEAQEALQELEPSMPQLHLGAAMEKRLSDGDIRLFSHAESVHQ